MTLRAPSPPPARPGGTRPACLALLALGLGLGAGCDDVRRFSGHWEGAVSDDPAQRQGFVAADRVQLTVGRVSRLGIDVSVVLPGAAGPLPFLAVRGASADGLGDLRLPGEPLRSYLGWLQPAAEAPLLAVISLYAEERVELRLLRGPDEIYGVFRLVRP